ncbi:branched-chain amino acid ABC transporter permease [Ferrovibrio sp.]|uniref:branched-chain amino acid ABC transporter permease n=1 Tax=Ferrovibrio sp. TaxID=1917215 RepID=UPI000CA93938|nr:branched-chain amino acid ABC transporter permease [Ferrovibrio sp.]PJI40923.1 MAG: branched-chain amino acid ABC transporter permease [Ferrovibrio sp.]
MLPTGIQFSTYTGEAGILKTNRARIGVLLIVILLLVAPLMSGPYLLGIGTQMFITLIAVYGLHVTVGMAGQINIAQSAFVGVGAFAAAKLSSYGLPFWVVLPLAAVITGLVSVLFALPAARVKGFYLALTTLAAQVLFPIVILGLPQDWLGGLVGLPVEPLKIAGYSMGSPKHFYYFTLALVLLATYAAYNLHRSRLGRALKAVRDNDVAAEVMGVPVLRYKITAFFTGSLFAGVAGACTAWFLQFVTIESFTLFASVWYLGMLIVGGLHSPVGAILGVLFITFLQEGLHEVATLVMRSQSHAVGGAVFATTNIVLGACILLALIFEPRGLAHRWSVLRTAYQLWPFPRQ